MFLDVNKLKNGEYMLFIQNMLKKNNTIVFSSMEPFNAKVGEVDNEWTGFYWYDVNITDAEFVNSYTINYHQALNFFEKFHSYVELFDETDIYRIIFASNKKITCVCMCDEIVEY